MIKKIRQLFCKHKNTGWFLRKEGKFQSISGETHYKFCQDCGKEIRSTFVEYEGNGFK